MRAATLLSAVAAAVALGGAATASPQLLLEAKTPANLQASSIVVSGLEWAILVFDAPTAAFGLDLAGPVPVDNVTWTHPARLEGEGAAVEAPSTDSTTTDTLDAERMTLAPLARSSVVVHAQALRFEAVAVAGDVRQTSRAGPIRDFLRPQDQDELVVRTPSAPADQVALVLAGDEASRFRLAADGLATVEWFAAQPTCEGGSWCPAAGGKDMVEHPGLGSYRMTTESYSYQVVHGAQALVGEGAVAYAVLGGPLLGVAFTGEGRFPLAEAAPACEGCLAPQGETLVVQGDIALAGLKASGPGTVTAGMSGTFASARLDEETLDPVRLGLQAIGLAAAAVTVAVALKVLGAALFSRLDDQALLGHPRRRLILEAVLGSPGIGFRELGRRLQVPANSVRLHLNTLLRHEKIVEHSQGVRLRYFENHGKFDQTWQATAILRDAALGDLFAWLEREGEHPQKDILDAWQLSGWGRSSTQHRLGRLEREGLVRVRRQGRLKFYSAADVKRGPQAPAQARAAPG